MKLILPGLKYWVLYFRGLLMETMTGSGRTQCNCMPEIKNSNPAHDVHPDGHPETM